MCVLSSPPSPLQVEYIIKNGGGPSLTLMNHDQRTPLTLAVRNPAIFNTIIAAGFLETVWKYGNSEMTLISLYQVGVVGKMPRFPHHRPPLPPLSQSVMNHDRPHCIGRGAAEGIPRSRDLEVLTLGLSSDALTKIDLG